MFDHAPDFTLNPGQERVWTQLYQSTCRFCLVYGGSRSGKTFLTVMTLIIRALKAPRSKHLIVRQEAAAARASLARGNTSTIRTVLAMCFPGLSMVWNEKYGYYELENGSEIWIGGLNDDKAMERILGNEYASIYINEASEVKHSAFILLRSRLAQVCHDEAGNPLMQRFYVDLNPTNRMHWTYRIWVDGVDPEDQTPVKRAQYGYAQINPHDNKLNLTADYLADLSDYGERARKRFLDGEYAADDENALWKREYFKRVQMNEDGSFPVKMRRICVAVDPAMSKKATSDETGIIAGGLGVDGNAYIFEDASGKYSPQEWGRVVNATYQEWDADRVIAEVNQGGDLVEQNMRAINPELPIKQVRASKNKERRAEPVAALYEKGRVYHVGNFTELEDQMCAITPGFDDKAQGWSPDRVDAAVWLIAEFFPNLTRSRSTKGAVQAPQFSMV